jgi:hypothetical protein
MQTLFQILSIIAMASGPFFVVIGLPVAVLWRSRRSIGVKMAVTGMVVTLAGVLGMTATEPPERRQARELEQAEDARARREAAAREDAERGARAAETAKAIAEADVAKAAKARAEEAACLSDPKCLGEKYGVDAEIECRQQVERLARIDFRWTDGLLEPKFPRYVVLNLKTRRIRYRGDAIQFQNSLGAFIRHVYECDFDATAGQVLEVRAKPGRL